MKNPRWSCSGGGASFFRLPAIDRVVLFESHADNSSVRKSVPDLRIQIMYICLDKMNECVSIIHSCFKSWKVQTTLMLQRLLVYHAGDVVEVSLSYSCSFHLLKHVILYSKNFVIYKIKGDESCFMIRISGWTSWMIQCMKLPHVWWTNNNK